MRKVGVAHRVAGLIEDLPALQVHDFQMRFQVSEILRRQSGQETVLSMILTCLHLSHTR
jgi:hypothetical protein